MECRLHHRDFTLLIHTLGREQPRCNKIPKKESESCGVRSSKFRHSVICQRNSVRLALQICRILRTGIKVLQGSYGVIKMSGRCALLSSRKKS
ncbi:hypothetical protein FGO68_gene5036 [Halteria grandinella]|uniref:Uncharacterized protein n=1 Tax=Halteria grandinella TaxID=5974 RepID=A0A8J8T206_HALGN|nr:hypothetical protein FGO68_gene5036 [Halteria grandinella]